MEKDMLLKDYEDTLQKQTILLAKQQTTIDSLHEETAIQQHRAEVTAKQVQARLESLQQQDNAATLQDFSDEIDLLKEKLETALKEKEASQAESRRQGLEVQRLHQALLASQGSHIPSKESEEYVRAVEALEEETLRLRTQASAAEEEKVVILKSNHDLKKKLVSLESQLEQERQSNQALKKLIEEKVANGQEVNDSFSALNTKFIEQSEDIRLLLSQVQSLKAEKDRLAKILINVRGKLKEGENRVAESLRIAEDSLVEKDAALLREKHALNEVHRLERSVSCVTKEAAKRTQAEVSKVKDEYNTNIKNISQEMAKLEMSLGEKQLECDRIHRELKKVMEEAEHLQGEMTQNKEHHRYEILNLQQRITSLETQLNSLMAEKDNISSLGLQTIKETEEQRKDLLDRITELEDKLRQARSESAKAKLEGEEAKRNFIKINNQLQKVQEESNRSHRFLKKHLRVKMEEVEELTAGAEGRLEASENNHREALTQCYQNTALIQENYNRLQTQMKEQKKSCEQRISELNQHLLEAQKQQQHTALSLRNANTSLAVTEGLLSQYKARVAEVEERLETSEQRFLTFKYPKSNQRT